MLDEIKFEKILKIIDLRKANIIGIAGIVPIFMLFFLPYYLIWKDKHTLSYIKQTLNKTDLIDNSLLLSLISILVMTIGIILHELIHGLTWSIFAKNGFKSIKFGILLKMLTPYCHCKEPLKVKHYILGGIMPGIVLGIIPAIYSIFIGNIFLLIFGSFFTLAAMGDFMIINLIRKENKDSFVQDHPTEAGCYVYRKK